MNDELVSSVANVLNEWNPLGEKALEMKDLEGYRYEAIDVLSTIRIAKLPCEKAVSQVLTQAFSVMFNESELKHYSAKIEKIINVQ